MGGGLYWDVVHVLEVVLSSCAAPRHTQAGQLHTSNMQPLMLTTLHHGIRWMKILVNTSSYCCALPACWPQSATALLHGIRSWRLGNLLARCYHG